MPARVAFVARHVVLVAVVVSALWLLGRHPSGVDARWFVLAHLAALAGALGVTALVAASVARRAAGGEAAASVVTALVALVAAPVSATAAMEQMRAASGRVWSEEMWELAPELGEGELKLLPNVPDAVAVVPDRPILLSELTGVVLDERVKRRRTFHVRTNALGLRGPPVESPKRRFRLLCLGSSVTFGHGVADDEAWCARVGEALGVEALNAGMPGRTIPAVAKWAALHAAALDPDLVLFSEVPAVGPAGEAAYVAAARSLQASFPRARLAIAFSPTSPFLPVRVPVGTLPDRAVGMSKHLPDIPMLDTTGAIWRAAERRGGLTVVFGDGVQRLVDRTSGEVLLEVEGDTLSPELCAAFERDPDLRVPFFIDQAHVDAEGHAVMAEAIVAWLRTQELVPG